MIVIGRAIRIVSVLALIATAALAGAQASGTYFIPGDAKAGMQLFFAKGCGRCHSVLGEGGRSAPDLARAPGGHLSAAELVAGMWNHAPDMWEKMQLQGVSVPSFKKEEMGDLFAFIYSVRSLDEPGDAARGRELLAQKKCLECHAVAGHGGHAGPDLKNWAGFRNPVSWVQTMWNHAPQMQKAMVQRGFAWPQFQDSDVADLIAYIRSLTPSGGTRVYLRPAEPDAGRRLFRAKGCVACHAVGGVGGTSAPDLGSHKLPRTLGQFAGQMWNHAPSMSASMRAHQVSRPQFSDKEMADLIAYLFAQRYFEAAGNYERGRQTFSAKGCVGCHGASGIAPDPAKWKGNLSPVAFATALWNHGSVMLQAMRDRQIAWPRFQPGEISDLMEFLNRRPERAQAATHP